MICGVFFDSSFSLLAQILHIQTNWGLRYLQLTGNLCLAHTSSSHFYHLGPSPLQLFRFNFRAQSLIFSFVDITLFNFLALSVYLYAALYTMQGNVLIALFN